MIIFLCGFSGAGKTHLLKTLKLNCANISWFFVDLDDEIIKNQESSISEIVARDGFDCFRKLETFYLKKIIDSSDKENCVVALGGGTLEFNMELIKGEVESKMVWLNVPFDECFERISGDNSRPLVSLGKKELAKIYTKRCENFKKADLVLSSVQIRNIKKLNQLIDLLK